MDRKQTEKVNSRDTTRHLQDCNRLNQVLDLYLSGLFKSGERIQKGRWDSSQAGIPDTLTRCLAVYSTLSRVSQPATCLKISPCEVQHLEDGGALWNLHTRQYLSVWRWAVSLPGAFSLFCQQPFHFLSASVWICSDGLHFVWRLVNCFQLIVGAYSEITGRQMETGKGKMSSHFPKKEMDRCTDRYAAVCSTRSRGMRCSQPSSISTHRDKKTHARVHTHTHSHTGPEIK